MDPVWMDPVWMDPVWMDPFGDAERRVSQLARP